jgi:hypothetical protein
MTAHGTTFLDRILMDRKGFWRATGNDFARSGLGLASHKKGRIADD